MRSLALALTLTVTTPESTAQLLDLDMPETPEAGGTTGANALADLLTSQADLHESKGETAHAELRRLGAALLNTGRPIPTLLGRTLAARLPELEALSADPDLDPIDRSLLLADLRRARAQIPVSTDQVDRSLRDALARLGDVMDAPPAGPGWVTILTPDLTGAPTFQRSIELLGALSGDSELQLSVERLASIVEAATDRTLYTPAGERLSDRVRSACTVLDSPPAWVSEEDQRLGAAGIALAIAQVMDPATRQVGADRLKRYAALGRLIGGADRLETTNDVRAFRARLASLLAEPPEIGTLEAVSRGLALALGDPALDRDETDLVRQLRPAWRWARRRSILESRTMPARLSSMLGVEAALTDPATLAVLTSARQSQDLARSLVLLSDLLDDDPAGPSKRPKAFADRAAIADRILAMSPELNEAVTAEPVLATIRLMGDDLRRADALLRRHPDPLPLATVCARLHASVLSTWGGEEGVPDRPRAAILRAERYADWLGAADLAEQLQDGRGLVLRWSGIELSPGAVEVIAQDLADKVQHALKHEVEAEPARSDKALATLDERYIVMRVLARLDRRLTELAPASDTNASVLSEIALGPPPDDAWLIDQRETLATLCTQAEELASAIIRDDRPAQRDFENALRVTAERLLRAIEGR